MLYIGETGRRLGDRFHEHLEMLKTTTKTHLNQKHFNLSGHSFNNMTFCALSLQQGNTESHKNVRIFKIGTLAPRGINERFQFH